MSHTSIAEESISTGDGPAGDPAQRGFSLVHGGPLYHLLLQIGLMGPGLELLHRRLVASVVITWVPLAVLTGFAGTLVGGVKVPFLFDLDAHVRLLISLPLFIGAELLVHRRIPVIADDFVERGLIAPQDRPHFDGLVAWAVRLRNSIVAEIVVLGLALTGGHWAWSKEISLKVTTWYATASEGPGTLTWAGYWFAFVSLPIARFFLLRWYLRLLIWYAFLWRVSRLRLQLNPLHPDRAGGLGFLEHSVIAFAPVLIGQSAFLAGVIGNRIWHEGAKLADFKLELEGFTTLLTLFMLLPLTFFVVQMARARRMGIREYSELGTRYARAFREKWLQDGKASEEALLGNEDIRSLADLENSYRSVHTMRIAPISKEFILHLAIVIALPLLPLALTMIPLDEVFERLAHLLL
jgi:hypothetical protein